MTVCTNFNANPSNSCHDISIKTTNVNLLVVQDEKSADHQSQTSLSPGSDGYVYKISLQFIQYSLSYFSLDQVGEPVDIAIRRPPVRWLK